MAEGSRPYHTLQEQERLFQAQAIYYMITQQVLSQLTVQLLLIQMMYLKALTTCGTTARWDTKWRRLHLMTYQKVQQTYTTNARAISALSGTDTDATAEGSTNLYYTDARVGSYLTSNSRN